VTRLLVVEADGGSRGNPGPAAYGAIVRDGETGRVLVEVAETIGEATNNVAEYRGVLAGIEHALEVDPDARIEARLDSKLIVEQMSGRWAIKNAALRELALAVRRLRTDVDYTWVPRAQNTAADRLVNEALDAQSRGEKVRIDRRVGSGLPDAEDVVGDALEERAEEARQGRLGRPAGLERAAARPRKMVGWATDLGTPTMTLLGRHGATAYSLEKRFSGSGGADPALAPLGEQQAEALAREIAARGGVDAIVASPLLRTLQTAERVAHATGASIDIEPGIAECSFGEWDGYTFAEVSERWPVELAAWLASTDVAPPGGESFAECRDRVDRARRDLLTRHAGQRVAVISHVTPIKLMTGICVDAPLSSLYRMELAPCSLTTIAWFADGNSSLFGFAESAHLRGVDPGFGV
jgi:ribonuclease H / adenosylcobalamin/alpha-ribazole phosphatase